jgi:hypothetical protein
MRTRVLPVPSSTRAPVDERLAPGGRGISGGRLILYYPPLQFATRMPRGGERGVTMGRDALSRRRRSELSVGLVHSNAVAVDCRCFT